MSKLIECFSCGKKFRENQGSLEHILLDSLGGKLTSKDLICDKCNNELGKGADSEVYKQLKSFAGILQTDNSKNIELQDEKGENRFLNRDYTPHHRVGFQNQNNQTFHSLPSLKDYEAFVKEKRKAMDDHSLKEKDERAIYFPKNQYSNGDNLLRFDTENKNYKKHMLKVGIEFYLYKNQDKEYITHIINCFQKDNISNQVIEYESNPPIYKPQKDEVSHIIYLNIDAQSHLIYCYIQYFNVTSTVVILNDNYKGSESESFSYGYDLLRKEELEEINVNLKIDNYDVRNKLLQNQGYRPKVKNKNFDTAWHKIIKYLDKKTDGYIHIKERKDS